MISWKCGDKIDLAVVLQIVTGLPLVQPAEVFICLFYMLGRPVAHDLDRHMDMCRSELLRQYPWLQNISLPENLADPVSLPEWLRLQKSLHGEKLAVNQLPKPWPGATLVEMKICNERRYRLVGCAYGSDPIFKEDPIFVVK